jgi:hypothetical protein
VRRNEALEAATRELSERGIPYEVKHGKKHWQVRWIVIAHRPRVVTISDTPTNRWKARLYSRADVRRMLRQDGR